MLLKLCMHVIQTLPAGYTYTKSSYPFIHPFARYLFKLYAVIFFLFELMWSGWINLWQISVIVENCKTF